MCCHTVQKTAQLPLHRTRGLDVTGKPPWACRLLFAYEILTPAALNFFVNYADGAVESLWSIDQYFEFVLVLLLSTGLSFQVRHGCLLSLYTFNATAALLCTGPIRLITICCCRYPSSRCCSAT